MKSYNENKDSIVSNVFRQKEPIWMDNDLKIIYRQIQMGKD